MPGGGATVTTGNGLTFTVTCVDAVHPLTSVPVTVYVVVEVGLAVTGDPVVELSAVDCVLSLLVALPIVADRVVDCPSQIVAEATVTTGRGFTFTVTCVDAVHPLTSVPVTVYVVVEVGLAVTGEPVVELSAVDGVHKYVVAPLAVSVAVCCPTQIAGGGATVTTGRGFTFTVTCVDAVHPFTSVPVTVYVVVEVGLAVTGEPVEELK